MSRMPLLLIAFVPALVYAVVRYLVIGTTPWSQSPAWVVNKAIAVAALLLAATALFQGQEERRREAGQLALWMAALHSLLSLALLQPAHYPKLYDAAGRLHAGSQTSLLAACIALLIMVALFKGVAADQRSGRMRWILALVAIHQLGIGLPGWLKPETWPAGLPPITLISFLLAVVPLFYNLRPNKIRHETPSRTWPMWCP